jgi:ATP-dependent DNA helicase RecG
LSEDAGRDSAARLEILVQTDDGFRIAEADLELRGPGEILGTTQAGTPALLVADLLRDQDVLHDAREAAMNLVEKDPRFERPEHARAWELLAARYGPLLELVRIG